MQDRFYQRNQPDYLQGAFNSETANLLESSGLTGVWDAWSKSQAPPFDRWPEANRGSSFRIAVNVAGEAGGNRHRP